MNNRPSANAAFNWHQDLLTLDNTHPSGHSSITLHINYFSLNKVLYVLQLI